MRTRFVSGLAVVLLLGAVALAPRAQAQTIEVGITDGSYWTNDLYDYLDAQPDINVSTFSTCDLATLQQYDVIWVYGNTTCYEQANFDAFVQAGGGIVGTPWAMNNDGFDQAQFPYALSGDSPDHSGSLDPVVIDASDPILAGVTFNAGDAIGYEDATGYTVTLRTGAVVPVEWAGGFPMVAYFEYGAGRSVYLNLQYITSDTDIAMYHAWGGPLAYNAVLYAADAVCDDIDGDGYDDMACGGDDCDDNDVNINPGAAEVLDGVDNNCDGLVDEGVIPPGTLFITEIMKDPSAVLDEYGEWFEIFNDSAIDLDLIGMEVTDLGTNSFTVDTTLVVPAFSFAVLGSDADVAANGGVTLDYEYTNFAIGNGDDEIILTHGGVELDSVFYDDPDWPDVSGESMSLDIDQFGVVENDDFANWCGGSDMYGAGDYGSPGLPNPSCFPCLDADGDGFLDAACGGDDCDDANPAANPGMSEIPCNFIDDDCDGALHIQETDQDGDGFSPCDGDCDEANADANPGAAEDPCDGFDTDCDGALHGDETDDDLDGYTECDGDCDDTDPTASPGMPEIPCDGVDNDCDGDAGTDENDEDGDGFSPCDGDCDDTEPGTFPGADEFCDGTDNDCDGDVDEDSAVDVEMWWRDADGDGYGNASFLVEQCYMPQGFIDNADDCDDTNADAWPGNTESYDATDNDCDGLVDEGALPADALIITEILNNPDMVLDDVGEWFEVYNNASLPLNLIGATVYDLGTNSFTIDADLWIDPDTHAVIGASDDDMVNGGVIVDYVWPDFALGNGDDEVIIEHGGTVLDEVQYDGGTLWIDPTGFAMSLDPTLYTTADNDDPASWCEAPVTFGLGDGGSPGEVNPTCCPDADGDGFHDDACGFDDCDDTDPAVFPGAEEICNGIDDDCDADTDELVDMDGDGFAICDGDCDDFDADIHPDAEEICDGEVDNDCDPATDELVDGDMDGYAVCDGDCDDAYALTYPGAAEICDGYDNDCDDVMGTDEVDEDLDGVLLCDDGVIGPDCNDLDATIYPDAPELCDGLDNDCDTEVDEGTDEDTDGDGYNVCQGDCDNDNADTYPGAAEICDGLDNDCDEIVPDDEMDADEDGWMVCDGDCDDEDAAMNLDDLDGDGVDTCDGDCDDEDDAVYPGADEVCDGVDNDCDGVGDDGVDEDGDGYAPVDCGGEDCDDADADINPDMAEVCDDGIDNDCDGLTDMDDTDECVEADDDDDTADDDDDDCECDASGSGSTGSAVFALLLGLALIRRRLG